MKYEFVGVVRQNAAVLSWYSLYNPSYYIVIFELRKHSSLDFANLFLIRYIAIQSVL